mgnify:CR=1 FL=1
MGTRDNLFKKVIFLVALGKNVVYLLVIGSFIKINKIKSSHFMTIE